MMGHFWPRSVGVGVGGKINEGTLLKDQWFMNFPSHVY